MNAPATCTCARNMPEAATKALTNPAAPCAKARHTPTSASLQTRSAAAFCGSGRHAAGRAGADVMSKAGYGLRSQADFALERSPQPEPVAGQCGERSWWSGCRRSAQVSGDLGPNPRPRLARGRRSAAPWVSGIQDRPSRAGQRRARSWSAGSGPNRPGGAGFLTRTAAAAIGDTILVRWSARHGQSRLAVGVSGRRRPALKQ